MTGAKVAACLDQVVAKQGVPQSIRVDNGTEFQSRAMDGGGITLLRPRIDPRLLAIQDAGVGVAIAKSFGDVPPDLGRPVGVVGEVWHKIDKAT